MKPLHKIVLLVLIIAVISGCSQNNNTENNETSQPAASISSHEIPIPAATGVDIESDERASIDYSNMGYGYVIVEFSETSEKTLRVAVKEPHGDTYFYALRDGGVPEIIPLTEGDGEYMIGIYENTEGSNYSRVISVKLDVVLEDDILPFLYPNQFVNFSKESELVALAAELTKDAHTTEEKIAAIYEYVVKNFTYDHERAATVPSGYLPNLDEVLKEKEGICFDYSALVTAMLRSQGIPTRLEIGYHGEEYHAWISKLCDTDGWIENRYHHNGEEWYRMDPTIESGEYKAHRTRHEARADDTYRLMYCY